VPWRIVAQAERMHDPGPWFHVMYTRTSSSAINYRVAFVELSMWNKPRCSRWEEPSYSSVRHLSPPSAWGNVRRRRCLEGIRCPGAGVACAYRIPLDCLAGATSSAVFAKYPGLVPENDAAAHFAICGLLVPAERVFVVVRLRAPYYLAPQR